MSAQGLEGNGIPEADQLDELEILKVGCFRSHHMLHQGAGFGHTGADENAHPGREVHDGLLWRYR